MGWGTLGWLAASNRSAAVRNFAGRAFRDLVVHPSRRRNMRRLSIGRCQARGAYRLLVIGVALLAIFVVGCGVSGTGGTSAGAHGVLVGKVVARPTCPVERIDNPCQPAPIPHRSVSIEDSNGKAVAMV